MPRRWFSGRADYATRAWDDESVSTGGPPSGAAVAGKRQPGRQLTRGISVVTRMPRGDDCTVRHTADGRHAGSQSNMSATGLTEIGGKFGWPGKEHSGSAQSTMARGQRRFEDGQRFRPHAVQGGQFRLASASQIAHRSDAGIGQRTQRRSADAGWKRVRVRVCRSRLLRQRGPRNRAARNRRYASGSPPALCSYQSACGDHCSH
jgi:hypothetical protein